MKAINILMTIVSVFLMILYVTLAIETNNTTHIILVCGWSFSSGAWLAISIFEGEKNKNESNNN